MPNVVWSAEAVEELLDLARPSLRDADRVRRAVEAHSRGDRVDAKMLTGSNDLRIRVGDWRVILGPARKGTRAVLHVVNRRDAYE